MAGVEPAGGYDLGRVIAALTAERFAPVPVPPPARRREHYEWTAPDGRTHLCVGDDCATCGHGPHPRPAVSTP